jgi:glycosyltransferase involved in cell wall biosynthesis
MAAGDKRAAANSGAARGLSIAIVTSIAYSLANFRGQLIEDLVARGLRVYALAPDFDEKTRAAVRALGAEPLDFSLERTGMRPLRDLRDTARLTRQLRQLKPDLTFCYFVKPVIYGSLAAWAAGVKRRYALVAGLGFVFAQDAAGQGIKRRLLQRMVSRLYERAFRVCRKVFFQNDDDVAHFVSAGRLDPGKVVRLAGTGVDLERLQPAPPQLSPIRFLLMARLLREKGIVEFAQAGAIVRRSHPGAEFILAGGLDPNPGGLSEAEIRRWFHGDGLSWLGHVDDVVPIIRACSVYVLPSYYREGVPRSIQEAMAMARPVITTDSIGCRDTVEPDRNGFLVPVRDATSLAAAMTRFIAEPGLIETMGNESRQLAEERFNVREINAKILESMEIQ